MTARDNRQAPGPRHVPVLLDEVLAHLAPRAGGHYLDTTFGAGGYTRAILGAAEAVTVTALDRDPSAIAAGASIVAQFAPRLVLRQQAFGALLATEADALGEAIPVYDGIVFDLGVSSMQLDEAARGFSFQTDGPLDMRMFAAGGSIGEDGPSAADVVNRCDEHVLADILYQLGDERRSRALAAAIVRRRAEQPFARTRDLVDAVISVLGKGRPGERHPATRTFQALRIYVNDELGQLGHALAASERLLKPGGRLVVVTFHSLEDRIVKRFLAVRSGRAPGGSRHAPRTGDAPDPSFRLVNAKALSPGNREVDDNPRARSARLRAAERTSAQAWDFDIDALDIPPVLLAR